MPSGHLLLTSSGGDVRDEVAMVPAPPGHQEGRGRRHGGERAQARDVAAGALHRVAALPGLEVAIVCQAGRRKLKSKDFSSPLFCVKTF